MKKGNQTNILSGQKVVKDLHLLRATQSLAFQRVQEV